MFSHTDCTEKVKQTEAALPAEATQNQDCVGTALPQAGGKTELSICSGQRRGHVLSPASSVLVQHLKVISAKCLGSC